jgi:uncharacterized membrane protein (UPF0136 family)
MIELTKYYYYLFGVMTIVGGAIGYFKAGSLASIIAGTVCGALLIFAGILIATKVQPALILGLLISLALAYRFIPAFLEKRAFMPGGLMSALCVIGAILTIITLIAPAAKR